jgi:hypothetical protein
MPYAFSDAEVKCLALLIRKHEAALDPALDAFKDFVEDSIYRMMTIEEAENFFR